MAQIDSLFEKLKAANGSDLHLAEGQPPKYRLHGRICPIPGEEILGRERIISLLEEIAPAFHWEKFMRTGDADFAYAMGTTDRFRANYYKHEAGFGAVFRIVPVKIQTLEQLRLHPKLHDFTRLRSGLVLVTGPTGSGKSTTLAAIINDINNTSSRHILSIEEPIEFVHAPIKSIIRQREVGMDTENFATALRSAVREDCDVILVGEMRDLETISHAISAAEMGVLVFGTLHTNSAAKAIDRIVTMYPAGQQEQIKTMLSGSLRGVVAQLLCPTADGKGRVAVQEILICNQAIAASIREGNVAKINSLISAGSKEGMILMDDALMKKYEEGVLSAREAYMKALDKKRFESVLENEAADEESTLKSGRVAGALGEGRSASAWRDEADSRIERFRKGNFTLYVVNAQGQSLNGLSLVVKQLKSSFNFGTCFTGNPTAENDNEKRYREFLSSYFNTLVCEREMLWLNNESERGVWKFGDADRLVDFALKNKFTLRGHCLLWSKTRHIQPWLAKFPDAELRAKIEERLTTTLMRYKGKVAAWDVVNEIIDGSYFAEKCGETIHADVFKLAHTIDPDARLFLNEYGILGNDEKVQRYGDLILAMQKKGAPIGGIGIQEHACERFIASAEEAMFAADRPDLQGKSPLIPDDVVRRLDRLGKLGLPIHITGISAGTRDEEWRASSLETAFRIAFSHPRVESIILWGFWESRHWLGNQAALVDARWNLLPAGRRIEQLLLHEWRTSLGGRTDAYGRLAFRGFYGTYSFKGRDSAGRMLEAIVDLIPGKEIGKLEMKPAQT